MNREEMIEELVQYYEAAGFNNYDFNSKSDLEIKELYDEITEED